MKRAKFKAHEKGVYSAGIFISTIVSKDTMYVGHKDILRVATGDRFAEKQVADATCTVGAVILVVFSGIK